MIDQSTINQTIVGLLLLTFSAGVVSILYLAYRAARWLFVKEKR